MKNEAKQVFDRWSKMWKDNRDGNTICFINRGCWSDPQVAYNGYLLNYWDVLDLACPEDATEDYEPEDQDWIDACMESLIAYTGIGDEPEEFQMSDVLSVDRVITI